MSGFHRINGAPGDELAVNGIPLTPYPSDRSEHEYDPTGFEEDRKVSEQELDLPSKKQLLALYDKNRRPLLQYLSSLRIGRDQAEELIQEAFARLTKEMIKGHEIDNTEAWIVRVTRNLAIDTAKRNDRYDAIFSAITDYGLDTWADPGLNPEQEFMQEERVRKIRDAVKLLTPQQQQCFQLRAQGFHYRDIGIALGISEQRAALVVKHAAMRIAAMCR